MAKSPKQAKPELKREKTVAAKNETLAKPDLNTLSELYKDMLPVSYTHLTLPTN